MGPITILLAACLHTLTLNLWCICSQLTAYGNEICSLHGVSPATVMALVFAAKRQVRLIQLRMPLTRHSRLGFSGICPAKLFYGHGCILNPALRISENCVATSDSGVSLPCRDNEPQPCHVPTEINVQRSCRCVVHLSDRLNGLLRRTDDRSLL